MQLYLLGRRLTKIGESAFVGPSISELPPGVALILMDVFAHPGTSISEVVRRTGLPQSHVSKSVARFRNRGAVTSAPDPADGRRTLVTPTAWLIDAVARQTSLPIDAALTNALGEADSDSVKELIEHLEDLAHRLAPRTPRGAGPTRPPSGHRTP
jgi:DNA-binding IscR family transcriptional regulator